MLLRSVTPGGAGLLRSTTLGLLLVSGSACAMAGFGGGALRLNITDQQTRQLTIHVDAGAGDARVIEIGGDGEVELGSGAVQIDRYVLQRATFGRGAAVGFFLCPRPCADPLSSYLVAYSPDQLFASDGKLELQFRVVSSSGETAIITRLINAEMLPDLWQDPRIAAGVGG